MPVGYLRLEAESVSPPLSVYPRSLCQHAATDCIHDIVPERYAISQLAQQIPTLSRWRANKARHLLTQRRWIRPLHSPPGPTHDPQTLAQPKEAALLLRQQNHHTLRACPTHLVETLTGQLLPTPTAKQQLQHAARKLTWRRLLLSGSQFATLCSACRKSTSLDAASNINVC